MSSVAIGMSSSAVAETIDRNFLGCDVFQWVREVLVNSIEGHAKNIEFGVEWEGVEKLGVHRRMISDDGDGMSSNQLFEYFQGLGVSSEKKIRMDNHLDTAIHSNFGMGCRISLLPLNKAGLVYISYQKGKGSMIEMQYDRESGSYVLHEFDTVDENGEDTKTLVVDLDSVEDWGKGEINWGKVAPAWVRDHGTCIVLKGNEDDEHTFIRLGKDNPLSNRSLMKYINSRFFDLSKIDVRVVEYNMSSDGTQWPKSRNDFHKRQPGKTNTSLGTVRNAYGALHYLKEKTKTGQLKDQGVVLLEEGRLKVHWFLWDKKIDEKSEADEDEKNDRDGRKSYSIEKGFIAVKYGNELFRVTTKAQAFRAFGISDAAVTVVTTFILEPKLFMQNSQWGVFPDQTRNNLVFSGYGTRNTDLPVGDWGSMFIDYLPEPILELMKKIHKKNNLENLDSDEIMKKIMQRINSRWKSMMVLVDPKKKSKEMGKLDVRDKTLVPIEDIIKGKVIPVQEGEKSEDVKPIDTGILTDKDLDTDPEQSELVKVLQVPMYGPVEKGRNKVKITINTKKARVSADGKTSIIEVKVKSDIPRIQFRGKDDFTKPFHICAYLENTPFDDGTKGPAVLINTECEMIQESITYHQASHHPSHGEKIKRDVLASYGTIACAKVIHILKFRKDVSIEVLKDKYLTEEALTTSLLGFLGEDAFIAPRLGKYGAKADKSEFEPE